jgi:hypothetical protein
MKLPVVFFFLDNERYQPRGKPRTPSSAASGGVLNPKGNKIAFPPFVDKFKLTMISFTASRDKNHQN